MQFCQEVEITRVRISTFLLFRIKEERRFVYLLLHSKIVILTSQYTDQTNTIKTIFAWFKHHKMTIGISTLTHYSLGVSSLGKNTQMAIQGTKKQLKFEQEMVSKNSYRFGIVYTQFLALLISTKNCHHHHHCKQLCHYFNCDITTVAANC